MPSEMDNNLFFCRIPKLMEEIHQLKQKHYELTEEHKKCKLLPHFAKLFLFLYCCVRTL